MHIPIDERFRAILFDDALADALGVQTLLWLWEAADIFHALEAALASAPDQATWGVYLGGYPKT